MTENEQKFLEFYDEYVTKIYRYVYFRVGSEQVAQDLTSDTFLKTWEYMKQGNFIGNLSAMTYQVCRNVISDYFRKNNSLPINLDEIAEINLIDTANKVSDKTAESLETEEILSCLKLIKVDYQEIIIWRFIDDFEIEEIAQILGKSEGSVRTLISRAVKALREETNKNQLSISTTDETSPEKNRV